MEYVVTEGRVERLKYKIDYCECLNINCYECQGVCDMSAIVITEFECYINENLCNRCGFCANVCPMGAIEQI